MSYIPSVNIEHNTANDFNYIVTENAKARCRKFGKRFQ